MAYRTMRWLKSAAQDKSFKSHPVASDPTHFMYRNRESARDHEMYEMYTEVFHCRVMPVCSVVTRKLTKVGLNLWIQRMSNP